MGAFGGVMSEHRFYVVGYRLSTLYVREDGPHKNVVDEWVTWEPFSPGGVDFFDPKIRITGPAVCGCRDCGEEWPEGGAYPPECVP